MSLTTCTIFDSLRWTGLLFVIYLSVNSDLNCCPCKEKYSFILQLWTFYELDFIASCLSRKFWKCAREPYLSSVVGKSLAVSGIFHNFAPCQSQSCHFDAGDSWKHYSLLVPIDDNQAELVAFVNQLILAFWLSISNIEHTSVHLSVLLHKSLSFL